MPIMPDCHGRLSCFAVEKSVIPRGDKISVIEFQTTAPPSRVNFREIRAPGVCKEKPRPGKQKLDTEGAEKQANETKKASARYEQMPDDYWVYFSRK